MAKEIGKYLHIYTCPFRISFISNLYYHLLSSFLSYRPATFQKDAAKQKKYYDVYQYVQGNPKNNGGGISNGATVCSTEEKKKRISMVMVPTKTDCSNDGITSCTNAYRLSKAAKVYHIV